MSRARGRNAPRVVRVDVKPNTPEGDDLALSDRQVGQATSHAPGQGSPIPGGRMHIANYPTVPQQVPIAVSGEEYRGIMAHGVAPEHATTHERATSMQGPNDHKPLVPKSAKEQQPDIIPVPVYIVPTQGARRPLQTAVLRSIQVPGFNGDPILVCGKDFNRTAVKLMNNDGTNGVVIGQDPTALIQDPGSATDTIGGTMLPKSMTSYQEIKTQDEIWAITLHATQLVELQIIIETAVPNAGARI